LIGAEIQRLRKDRGFTLEQLAARAGVSKSVLSQVERDQTNPTIATLWRIAEALGIRPESFFAGTADDERRIERIKDHAVPRIASEDGLVQLAILGPLETADWLQWYDVTFAPGGVLASASHGEGSREHLTVIEGALTVETPNDRVRLNAGDTGRYATDVRHVVRNDGEATARATMVVLGGERTALRGRGSRREIR
jgi:transcriptional regulator with XRE-family HTH domain